MFWIDKAMEAESGVQLPGAGVVTGTQCLSGRWWGLALQKTLQARHLGATKCVCKAEGELNCRKCFTPFSVDALSHLYSS